MYDQLEWITIISDGENPDSPKFDKPDFLSWTNPNFTANPNLKI